MDKYKAYIENIQKLIDLTIKRKIDWKKQNDSTFYFARTLDNILSITSIQRIKISSADPNEKYQFIFQIRNMTLNEIIVVLDSKNSIIQIVYPALAKSMENLYNDVQVSLEQNDLDFFNDIINNLNK